VLVILIALIIKNKTYNSVVKGKNIINYNYKS